MRSPPSIKTSAFPEILVKGVRRSWLTERSSFDRNDSVSAFTFISWASWKSLMRSMVCPTSSKMARAGFFERPDFPLVRD